MGQKSGIGADDLMLGPDGTWVQGGRDAWGLLELAGAKVAWGPGFRGAHREPSATEAAVGLGANSCWVEPGAWIHTGTKLGAGLPPRELTLECRWSGPQFSLSSIGIILSLHWAAQGLGKRL